MSFFNLYFNLRRERTLRTFSGPASLARFDHFSHWIDHGKAGLVRRGSSAEIHHY